MITAQITRRPTTMLETPQRQRAGATLTPILVIAGAPLLPTTERNRLSIEIVSEEAS